MVLLELVDGRKGEGDTLVLVTSYGEPLSFHELLFILQNYFESEHRYYPVSQGNLGKGMLLSAISCLACGVPLETILKRFKLNRKTKKPKIIDKRKGKARVLKAFDNLVKVL